MVSLYSSRTPPSPIIGNPKTITVEPKPVSSFAYLQYYGTNFLMPAPKALGSDNDGEPDIWAGFISIAIYLHQCRLPSAKFNWYISWSSTPTSSSEILNSLIVSLCLAAIGCHRHLPLHHRRWFVLRNGNREPNISPGWSSSRFILIASGMIQVMRTFI